MGARGRGRRGLGRDLGLAGKIRRRLAGPLRARPSCLAPSGPGSPSSPAGKDSWGLAAVRAFGDEIAPVRRYCGAQVRVAALPTPRGRPAAPGGAAAGPPAAPLGPSVRGPRPPPAPQPSSRGERVCAAACVGRGGGGRGTETNNKPPPARPQPPLLFGNEFWQEISS